MHLASLSLLASIAYGAALNQHSDSTVARSVDDTCQPIAASDPTDQYHCGKSGRLKPRKPKTLGRHKSCTGDYVGCYIQCAATAGCATFSYSSSNNYCRLFEHSLDDMAFQAIEGSPVSFYDQANCFTAPDCNVACPVAAPQYYFLEVYNNTIGADGLQAFADSSTSHRLSFSDGFGTVIPEAYTLDSSTGYLTNSDGLQVSTYPGTNSDPPVGQITPDPSGDGKPLVCSADPSSLALSCGVEGFPNINQFLLISPIAGVKLFQLFITAQPFTNSQTSTLNLKLVPAQIILEPPPKV